MARVLDDAKKRVKKLKKGKTPKVSTGRRGRKALVLLLPVALVGGYVVSRLVRGKNGQETDIATEVGAQQDKV